METIPEGDRQRKQWDRAVKSFDVLFKAVIAILGFWANSTYQKAQDASQAAARQAQFAEQQERAHRQELQLVSSFLEPLASDGIRRQIAGVAIGRLSDCELIYALQDAVKSGPLGFASVGPKCAKHPLGPQTDEHFKSADTSGPGLIAAEEHQDQAKLPAVRSAKQMVRDFEKKLESEPSVRSAGYVYVGHWDKNSATWKTHYFEPGEGKDAPLGRPLSLVVGTELKVNGDSVALRQGTPDLRSGANAPFLRSLPRGARVRVTERPIYNTGENDDGYIWLKVEI